MSQDKLDRLIEATFENGISGFKGLDDINIPSEYDMMQKFRSRISKQPFVLLPHGGKTLKYKSKRILNTVITAATIAFVILVASSIFSIIFDTSKIKAVKFNIIHSFIQLKDNALDIIISSKNTEEEINEGNSNPLLSSETQEVKSEKLSMDDLIKKVKYPIIIPGYLPDGYILKDIQLEVLPSGTNQITQTYVNSDNIIFTILQSTNANDVNTVIKAPANTEVTSVTILGINVQMISSGEFAHQVLWFNNGYKYQISVRFSLIEFNKLISDLKYSR